MSYEPDDGPLTDEQLEAIRAASPATDTPEELFTENLFPKAGALADQISRIIREVFGAELTKQWPILDREPQPLTIELANDLRNKSAGNLFLMGTDIADYVRFTNSEEYFMLNDGAEGALHPWFDVHHSKSGREAGYVGMLMGIEVYTHPSLPQNVFICLQHGTKQNAVIGHVKI
uniref:Uncharacterized protein n=1 Tax=Pseudomonas phage HRDY3 TaxID=3236930 RepID=A0AB39CE45_9VIRU